MLLTTLPLLALLSSTVSGTQAARTNDLVRRATTGDSKCGTYMCVAATVNGASVEYVLSSTGKKTPGWMAVGFGRQMSGSPMVIMWSNSDGNITLSQRSAGGEYQPVVDNSPPRVATLSADLSSTSGDIKYAFTFDANSDTTENIIFAFGTTNPGSSAEDANLQQHLDYTIGTLDLTKTSSTGTSTGSGSSPSSTSTPGGDSSSTDDIPLLPFQRLIVAHAIFCVLGFLLFLPTGALLARYLRTFSPAWYTGHWISQFAIAGPTIIIGVALGIQSVVSAGALHLNDDHKKWGIALFVLYIVQCVLGAVIHWIKPKRSSGRPPQNYLHAILGLIIIALAFYQVRDGYSREWPKTTGRGNLPNGVNIVWYIWVVLLPVLYAAGLAFLPKQFRQEKAPKSQYGNASDSTDQFGMQPRYRDY